MEIVYQPLKIKPKNIFSFIVTQKVHILSDNIYATKKWFHLFSLPTFSIIRMEDKISHQNVGSISLKQWAFSAEKEFQKHLCIFNHKPFKIYSLLMAQPPDKKTMGLEFVYYLFSTIQHSWQQYHHKIQAQYYQNSKLESLF